MTDKIPSKAMIALCNLTPGGSEFANDIEACVTWIRNRYDSSHEQIKKQVKDRKEVEKDLVKRKELIKLLRDQINRYRSDCLEMQNENQALKTENFELRVKLDLAKSRVENLKEHRDRLIENCDSLKRSVTKLNSEKVVLQSKLKEVQRELCHLGAVTRVDLKTAKQTEKERDWYCFDGEA